VGLKANMGAVKIYFLEAIYVWLDWGNCLEEEFFNQIELLSWGLKLS
jgi:hypothetical protein